METTVFTEIISACVEQLSRAGFDASAFETAKWAGVACFLALALSAIAGFWARLVRKNPDIAPPVSEAQFRWLLYVGALLIALPIVAKVTTDNTTLNFASADRSFAQQICQEQFQSTAQTAEIGALEAQVAALSNAVERTPPTRPNTAGGVGVPRPPVTTPAPALLGQAVSVFYRSQRLGDATRIADILKTAGAGVATRDTDLSETTLADTAQAGAIYILATPAADMAASAVEGLLQDQGLTVTEKRTANTLRGNPIQILLY